MDKIHRFFPILHPPEGARLTKVPWEFLLPHEGRAKRTHSQSLERLAQRGGLGAGEMLAVLWDMDWFVFYKEYDKPSEEWALAEIEMMLTEWTKQGRPTMTTPTEVPITETKNCLACRMELTEALSENVQHKLLSPVPDAMRVGKRLRARLHHPRREGAAARAGGRSMTSEEKRAVRAAIAILNDWF